MSVPATSKSPWFNYIHRLGRRSQSNIPGIRYYDSNVRYALEDIALQLGRIADALEGKKADE